MISAARILGLAAAAAVLLGLSATATPANAQASCKSERVTVKSEGRIRGEAFARNEAKERWEKETEVRFGRSFGRLANAKDSNVECESVKSKRLGLPAVICTATGRPCQGDDNAEAPSGRRGGAKLGDRKEWRGPEARAYAREMAHQDYMARMRKKIADRQYKREMAYRRYIEHDHWRATERVLSYAHRAYFRHRDFSRYRTYDGYCDCASYDYDSYYPSHSYYSHFYEMRGRQWRPEERRTGGRAWWKRMDREGRGGRN